MPRSPSEVKAQPWLVSVEPRRQRPSGVSPKFANADVRTTGVTSSTGGAAGGTKLTSTVATRESHVPVSGDTVAYSTVKVPACV